MTGDSRAKQFHTAPIGRFAQRIQDGTEGFIANLAHRHDTEREGAIYGCPGPQFDHFLHYQLLS